MRMKSMSTFPLLFGRGWVRGLSLIAESRASAEMSVATLVQESAEDVFQLKQGDEEETTLTRQAFRACHSTTKSQ